MLPGAVLEDQYLYLASSSDPRRSALRRRIEAEGNRNPRASAGSLDGSGTRSAPLIAPAEVPFGGLERIRRRMRVKMGASSTNPVVSGTRLTRQRAVRVEDDV